MKVLRIILFSFILLVLPLSPAFGLSAEQVVSKVSHLVVQVGSWNYVTQEFDSRGSGFIAVPTGQILTASHVIAEDAQVAVRIKGDIVLLGWGGMLVDTSRDAALINFGDGGKTIFPALKMEPVKNLRVGQEVLILGFPFGSSLSSKRPTVSRGIISALNRTLSHSKHEYIQIDGMINGGSSGGPVVTMDGKVIGIVFAMITGNGYNTGVNLVIPMEDMKDLIPVINEGWGEINQ